MEQGIGDPFADEGSKLADAGVLRRPRRRRRRLSPPTTEEVRRVLDLHTQARAEEGLPPLVMDAALTRAAEGHSADMLAKNYFSHANEEGQAPAERIAAAGYAYLMCGENIAWGSGSYGEPDRIMLSWLDSPGHKANIVKKGFLEIGIGISRGRFQGYDGAAVYTVTFGTERG